MDVGVAAGVAVDVAQGVGVMVGVAQSAGVAVGVALDGVDDVLVGYVMV